MLSITAKNILCRGTQFNLKIFRNRRLNGSVSDAKAARTARKSKVVEAEAAQVNAAPIDKRIFVAAAVLTVGGICVYNIKSDRKGMLGTIYWGSPVEKVITVVNDYFFGWMSSIFIPYEDKLLPTWPTDPVYGNPPAGSPCPPCLVLDLEKTLIGSEHSAQFGWRHVKRPGLDQFLEKLSSYYEIVIFSENDVGVVQDLLMAIDPQSRTHKLGSAAAESRDGVMIKRLDFMNRDLGRIILIDDSAEASQMFPRNTLSVKPFTDVNDQTDTVLFDLVPLLQAFVHDQSTDFRDTLDDLGTHEAEEACIEYRMRVSEKKAAEERKRNRGLGGLVRSKIGGNGSDLDPSEFRSRVLSASQIVGAAPEGMVLEDSPTQAGPVLQHKGFAGKSITTGDTGPKVIPPKKKGAIFAWLDESEKEREEHQMRKNEKMNELYGKRMNEKALKEEKAEAERRLAEGRL